MSESLKAVVRKLPANLPEDIFWISVKPWVDEDSVSWKVYYPGKVRKRLNKEHVPSRAYIAFKSDDLLAKFSKEYDHHLFRDKEGNESYALVEYAPYQKIPAEKKKVDNRNATIEKDEDYISFVESLNAPTAEDEISSADAMLTVPPPAPPKTTPLLEALKAEKAAVKEKEIMQRQAQAKEQPNQAKKDEANKKVPIPAKQNADPPSKKAAKKAANMSGHSSSTAPANKAPTPKKTSKTAGKQASSAKSAPTPAPAPAPPVIVNSHQPSTSSAEPPVVPPSAPRRGRPIIGLASRHFEAALTGAGVATSERKPRREREQAKQREKASLDGPSHRSNASPSTSPKKDRPGRRTEPSVDVTTVLTESSHTVIPQGSPHTLPKRLDADHLATPNPVPPVSNRGRGRGRGRGGHLPPNRVG